MANFFELWSPLLIFFSPSLGGYQPLLPVCLSLSNLLLAEKPDNQVIREPRRFCLRLNPRTCFLTLGSLFKHLFFHPSSTRDLAGWPSLPLTLLPSAFLNLVFFSLGWLWICSVFRSKHGESQLSGKNHQTINEREQKRFAKLCRQGNYVNMSFLELYSLTRKYREI